MFTSQQVTDEFSYSGKAKKAEPCLLGFAEAGLVKRAFNLKVLCLPAEATPKLPEKHPHSFHSYFIGTAFSQKATAMAGVSARQRSSQYTIFFPKNLCQ